jgi:hypothetical protein
VKDASMPPSLGRLLPRIAHICLSYGSDILESAA